MKRFIETLKNIWKIVDLRKRILYTLGIILIYRLGSFVVLPGIDPSQLGALQKQTEDGVLGLIDVFSGGAFSHASIFALGIMPYISASIIIQILGMAVPYFQRLQRDGESGFRKINQITRYLTVFILLLQAPGYLANLHYQLPESAFALKGFFFTFSSTVILIAGTMFVMWLGERITEKGIGNGISLIIMIGIIARLPFALTAEFFSRSEEMAGGLVMFLVELVVLFLVFMFSILLVQGTRRVPVQYAKRVVGNKQYGGSRQYIPLKVNAAGVMPIIFAQALMVLPVMFTRYGAQEASGFIAAVTDIEGFWYNCILAVLIVLFTYLYTAITVNPNQIAEDLKRNGGFIPGVKPGRKTVEYLYAVVSKITLPGALFLAFIAILPSFAVILFNVNSQFAQFFGGTSLLILVGVVLDTLQQIESHLLLRHYDGLMRGGTRIKGKGY